VAIDGSRSARLDKALLESWCVEFRDMGYWTTSDVRVLVQEDDFDARAGLIVVDLSRAKTVTYLQPATADGSRWVATMEARDESIELDARAMLRLGNELTVLSALCSFLEAKSAAHMG
jgi:hypothetical protein